jgi:hypothetical protein
MWKVYEHTTPAKMGILVRENGSEEGIARSPSVYYTIEDKATGREVGGKDQPNELDHWYVLATAIERAADLNTRDYSGGI